MALLQVVLCDECHSHEQSHCLELLGMHMPCTNCCQDHDVILSNWQYKGLKSRFPSGLSQGDILPLRSLNMTLAETGQSGTSLLGDLLRDQVGCLLYCADLLSACTVHKHLPIQLTQRWSTSTGVIVGVFVPRSSPEGLT